MHNRKTRRVTAIGGLVLVAFLALAGCGKGSDASDNGSGSVSTSSSSAVDGMKEKAQAIASSSANVEAKDAVKEQVSACLNATPTSKLATKAGRHELGSCLGSLVTPDKRSQLIDCAMSTAVTDKVWTTAGKAEYENSGVAKCILQVNGETSASPKVSPSPTKTPSTTSK